MAISRLQSSIITAVATTAVLGTVAAVALTLRADTPNPSIAPALGADESAGDGSTATSEVVMSDSVMMGYGGPGMGGPAWEAHWERCEPVMSVIWGPSPEDIEASKAENARIIEVLEQEGVAYEVVTEPDGWEHVEPADEDDWEAFEQAMESYYSQQSGPPEHELERMREDNQELIAFLDERGIEYEVMTEPDGWEHVEPAGDDGWEAMEEFWNEQERERVRERAEAAGVDPAEALDCQAEERRLSELSEQLHMFPFPMDTTMADQQAAMVADLMAAFDEAGIEYERVDVPILEWDVTTEGAAEIVRRVAEEHGHGWDEPMFESGVMLEEEAAVEETVEPEPAG